VFLRRYSGSPRSHIVGLGTYLPSQVVTSEELEADMARQGVPIVDGFIERVTGVATRRVAAADENASDLAAKAASAALAEAHLEARDVDLLIFAAASHDLTEPATANLVQSKLGAARAETYDVKNACNSFMSGLDVANAYVRSGMAETVLVVTGEIPSRAVDLTFTSQRDLTEKFSHLTMGDAGAAVVVTSVEEPERGILATCGLTRGELWHLSTILSGGTMYSRDMSPARAYLRSNGPELEEWGRRDIPPVVKALLAAVDWSSDSVDVMAMQQHSSKIICELATMMGIRESAAVLPLAYAGNAVAANIPLVLAHARQHGRLAPGTRVLLLGASSGVSIVASAVRW
jgi:3-oxoacyl-[acyl-carrier-protein] synthase-3